MDLFNDKGLSFERLRSLVKVHQRGGLSKAAPRDVMRQNLIGRQLRELEAFFHVKLTDKRGKLLVLNKRGEQLALIARGIIQSVTDFKRESISMHKVFRLASGGSLHTELITPRSVKLADQELEVHLNDMWQEDIIEGVLQGDLDAGVVWSTIPTGLKLKKISLGKFSYALLGPKKLLKKVKAQDQTLSLPLVVVKGRDMTKDIMQRVGSNASMFVSDNNAAFRLVESGSFAAVMPSLYERHLPPQQFSSVPLEFLKPYTREVHYVWSSSCSLMRGFSESMMEKIARNFKL